MSRKTWVSRRDVLRGLGVALALPWLESLAPRPTRAQMVTASPIKRYLLMYFPCGVARAYWPPQERSPSLQFNCASRSLIR